MGVREIGMHLGNRMVEIDTAKGFKVRVGLKKALLCANNAAAILAVAQNDAGSAVANSPTPLQNLFD